MLPVVAIVGKSESGKTTLIEKLITEFKDRGYRVAAVKHSHHHVDLDVEGKDTWRFMRAGSVATIISSPLRFTVFKDSSDDPTAEEMLSALGDGYDIILVEGFKRSNLPKIEVHRSELGEDLICTPDEIHAVISDAHLPLDIPQFGGGDIEGIANFIEHNILSKAGFDTAVSVNGRKIFLNDFVQHFFSGVIFAMLNSLKNVDAIKNVTISIWNK